jgi:hypothetical protein
MKKIDIDWINESNKYLDIRNERQFISNFGVQIWICNYLFSLLLSAHGFYFVKWKPIHLLYALYFLKLYPIDEQAAAIFRITRKSYSKWLWITILVLYNQFKTKAKLVSIKFVNNKRFIK